MKQFTFEEVKGNNGNMRTVFAIHDKVYDVTSFLNEHPGGEEILLDHGGKDATEDFNDVGHSTDALELMKKYQVGEIVESERRNIPQKQGWKPGQTNTKQQDKNVDAPGLPLFTLAAAALFAVFVYYYFVM